MDEWSLGFTQDESPARYELHVQVARKAAADSSGFDEKSANRTWPGRQAGTLKAHPDVGDRANLLKHLSSGNVQRTLRRLSEPNSPPGSRARHRLYDERFDGVGWATSGMADDEQEHED